MLEQVRMWFREAKGQMGQHDLLHAATPLHPLTSRVLLHFWRPCTF